MIELSQSNMYANGRVVVLPDGTSKLLRDRLIIIPQETDEFYTVKPGDRLEQIAWLKWNKIVENASFYWWVLMDANNIKNPLDLSQYVGKRILIPEITRIKLEYGI